MEVEMRQMTVDDFLTIMDTNPGIYPEWDNLPNDQKRGLAELNITTGSAQSYFEDDVLIGVGGIRFVGVGEAWMITRPETRSKKALTLFKTVQKLLAKTIEDNNLWRVFAASKISENFLKHLGFKAEPETFCWTRTK